MKTTIEIPDSLFQRTKIFAAQNNKSMKDVFIESLNRLFEKEAAGAPAKKLSAAEAKFFEIDPLTGITCLKRRNARVTQAKIDAIREEEGI